MPLPLILGGIAFAAAGYGVKKGFDAKDDYDIAESYNEEAEEMYEKAMRKLDKERKYTENALVALGTLKFNIYKNSIIPFNDSFSKIKNIKKSIIVDGVEHQLPSKSTLNDMQSSNLELTEMVSGGITALGAGGLAGLAAYGSIGVFATASSGTAIAGLSGIAATNATLAWLGGGSLAAGGMGMLGGTAILGSIVAAPVLLVGGLMMSSKAEAVKEDALANLRQTELAVEEIKTAITKTRGMKKKILELSDVIHRVDQYMQSFLSHVNELTQQSVDYKSFSRVDQEKLYLAYSTYETLLNLLNIPFLTKKGNVTKKVKDAIKETLPNVEAMNGRKKMVTPKNSKSLNTICKKIAKNCDYIDNFFILGKNNYQLVKEEKESHQKELLLSYKILGGIPGTDKKFVVFALFLTPKNLTIGKQKIKIKDIYSVEKDNSGIIYINNEKFDFDNEQGYVMNIIYEIMKEYIQ